MKTSTPLLVILGAIVLLGAAIFLPAIFVKPKPPANLPWQVQVTPAGGVEVFGIAVGESTLAQAEQKLGEGAGAEVTLFRSREGKIGVEGYFDRINLNGLDAKIVVGLRIPAAELEGLYDRGVQASKTEGGSTKVSLASVDRVRVGSAVIDTLTYMPAINLDGNYVAKRFGEPAEKWKERGGSDAVHWLYPKIGLDVAISETAKEVLQYVPPAEFERLRTPLTAGERVR